MQKTNSIIDIKALVALGALGAILGLGSIAGFAQADTVLSLTINAGVLTMYAGDDTDNDDLCTPADDASTIESVACSANERSALLSGLNVSSSRQNSTATIEDILFEDLRGLASATYTVTASMCDLTSGDKVIALGTNPDAVTADSDNDAPTASDAGKLFATLDPSVGSIAVLRPASAVAEYTADNTIYEKGAKTTVVSTATQVTVFNTKAATNVIPGRADIDGVTLKHRVPAFVEAGSYSCEMTFTVI
jgi:hypothetical protein